MKLQEHEYKARDKTVHKMSRDGLREENLHNKEEKRITRRDEDIEVSRNPKKEEDFGKNRRERITESKDIPTRKKTFDITRYSIDEEQKVKMEQDLGNEDAKEDMSLTEDSGPDKHSEDDMIYRLLILEDYFPEMKLERNGRTGEVVINLQNKKINEFLYQWGTIRGKKKQGMISEDEYMQWRYCREHA